MDTTNKPGVTPPLSIVDNDRKADSPGGVVFGLSPHLDMVNRMMTMWKALGKEPVLIWLPMEWCIKMLQELRAPKIEKRFRFNNVEFRASDGVMTVVFKG